MSPRRFAAAAALLVGCAATPPAPEADTVTVNRADLRAVFVAFLAERQARLQAEKALSDLQAKSGCI